MRNQPINKRLQEVREKNKLNLFATIAWNKNINKDFIRESQMDEIRLRDKEKK